ncbi:MAG: hypothetical protein IKP60_06620 [Treponema sp.]|nr:hypothetical protein [Treponema sp.]
MNKLISKIGAAIVTMSVFLFALFLIADFTFGSFLVCMFLPIGYIMMAAGFQNESKSERRVSANVGLVLAAIYATFILIVYFAQNTSVRLENLNEQAKSILDFKRGGLIFNYDLLGYGMMALSTFFIGLSIESKSKSEKWLKGLLIAHGIFFIACFVMPMTGMFKSMANGDSGKGGTIALVIWCMYFLPIGILSFIYFGKNK